LKAESVSTILYAFLDFFPLVDFPDLRTTPQPPAENLFARFLLDRIHVFVPRVQVVLNEKVW
jgi:hypothetical protein